MKNTHNFSKDFIRNISTHRSHRKVEFPRDSKGKIKNIVDYFGENVFDYRKSQEISEKIKKELDDVVENAKPLTKELAEEVAKAVTNWARNHGATHFCHWFHPLTGSTAEKHDSFINFDSNNLPIEKLGASALIQGEPDASSFPNGGSRSTFEARGYTSWDISSPMFLVEGINGKTLTIPSAFVSYNGDALDIKTPLLKSIGRIDKVASKFLKLTGQKDIERVIVTCGAEQEYFLVDKSLFYARPDLVMTGRTLQGKLSTKNQQLSDHYFGTISCRVLSFMQELDYELHRLGIPSKTRHNEVAPGQFEVAPIFGEANLASDQNQLVMAYIKKTAEKHGFVALLHEKPFSSINGSGKHVNWSMSDNSGVNLLEPGETPEENYRFLTIVSIILEAVYRHADALRMSVGSHGNDHRLGGHEAPPSVISVFLGDTLTKIMDAIESDKEYFSDKEKMLDISANQIANLFVDNTDRNRTSPFAFTGNKFEFRAPGSSQPTGFPLTIINAAVAEVMEESNQIIESELKSGKDIKDILKFLIKKWIKSSKDIVFNGDGYTGEWLKEAERRNLPNLKNSYEAFKVLKNEKSIKFLVDQKILSKEEIESRYNVFIENYTMYLGIEASTLSLLIGQNILSYVMNHKLKISEIIKNQNDLGHSGKAEKDILNKLNIGTDSIYFSNEKLKKMIEEINECDSEVAAKRFANDVVPLMQLLKEECSKMEVIVPESDWNIPNYTELLFHR